MLGRIAQRPLILLAGANLAMLGVLLYVGRWLVFWWDEWRFVFDRPDPTPRSVLAPFFDTFVAVPVLVYEALLAQFGLRTYLPYLLVDWASHFAVAFLLYRIVSRRSGVVLGLAAGFSFVFLGSGFEVLLQPFQIQYQFAILGGLMAIDQIDCRRPVIAAVLLLPAIASSGLGVIFVGLIVVWGLLRRHRGTLLAAAPAIAGYAAWYFTWGRESGHLTGPGLGLLDGAYSVLYGIGAAVSGLIGLPSARFALLGLALVVAALALVAALGRRGYRPDPLAAAAIAALVAEQVLRVIYPRTLRRRLREPVRVRVRRGRLCLARGHRSRREPPAETPHRIRHRHDSGRGNGVREHAPIRGRCRRVSRPPGNGTCRAPVD